jgi:hypothetical protein
MAQAGLVIGAMSFNVGWMVAGLCWALGGVWILVSPAGQDYVLGAAVGIGFMLVGILRKGLVPERSADL